jgi:hypothetical protein
MVGFISFILLKDFELYSDYKFIIQANNGLKSPDRGGNMGNIPPDRSPKPR